MEMSRDENAIMSAVAGMNMNMADPNAMGEELDGPRVKYVCGGK